MYTTYFVDFVRWSSSFATAGGGGPYRQAVGIQVPANAQPEEQQRDRGDWAIQHASKGVGAVKPLRGPVPKYVRPRSLLRTTHCY